jgi:chemotaxis protein methyltransferase CheR
MKATDCDDFLQWSLPRLHLSWKGFRNVRGQVCKRLARRVRELGLSSLSEYRAFLDVDPAEWDRLRGLCRVTITRFYRDRGVFRRLDAEVFPRLARRAEDEGRLVDVWCAGCAGGEEPYTVSIVWRLGRGAQQNAGLRIVATDIDATELERARRGSYPAGALRELPDDLRERAFERVDGGYVVRTPFRADIDFRQNDITKEMPPGPFDLIFCRNLVFTYFDDELRRNIAREIGKRLRPGGVLVIGKHEVLPLPESVFEPLFEAECIYHVPGP